MPFTSPQTRGHELPSDSGLQGGSSTRQNDSDHNTQVIKNKELIFPHAALLLCSHGTSASLNKGIYLTLLTTHLQHVAEA